LKAAAAAASEERRLRAVFPPGVRAPLIVRRATKDDFAGRQWYPSSTSIGGKRL
jgi:hypothetical protein